MPPLDGNAKTILGMILNFRILNFLTLLLISSNSIAQTPQKQKPYDRRDMLKVIDSTKYNNFKTSYPITRDTLNKFPDSLIIEGNVVDYITGVSCGIFCGCGTLKIKLIKANNLYSQEYIYIGVPCFNEFSKGLKTKTIWKLSKLPLDDKSCFWTEVPVNKFDTKGLPFYTILEYSIQ